MNITLIVGAVVGALFVAPLAWVGGDFYGTHEARRALELEEALADAESALEAKQQDLDAQRAAASQAAAAARESQEQAEATRGQIDEYETKLAERPAVAACAVDDDLVERANRLLDTKGGPAAPGARTARP